MTHRALRHHLVAALLLCASPPDLAAQEVTDETSRQVWGNFITAFPQTEKLYLEADAEVATQVSGGGDDWR